MRMKSNTSGAIVVAAFLSSVAVGAQSGGAMATSDKMDHMKKMNASYTGCVESGAAAGTFTLTHVAAADGMTGKAMKKDGMKEDGMAKDSMSHDSMTPATLALTGSAASLRKHVGHKVTVVGSPAHDTMDAMGKDTMDKGTPSLAVTSIKMLAPTCS